MQKFVIFPEKTGFFSDTQVFSQKIPPQTLDKQGISLYYPTSILSSWLVNIYQPWNWSVKNCILA